MDLRCLYVLPLLFLGAAAAPSGCGPSADVLGSDSAAPSGIGRTHLGEASSTDGYAAIRMPDTTSSCDARLPPVGNPTTLQNATDDVMHGLPSSDVLAPVNQPRHAPLYR